MSRSLVLGSVLVALALLVATITALAVERARRTTDPGGPAPLQIIDVASVEAFDVAWAGGDPEVSVERDQSARWWIVDHAGSAGASAWPAGQDRVRAFLRLLASVKGEEAEEDEYRSADAQEIRLRVRAAEGVTTIGFKPRAAGGGVLAVIERPGVEPRVAQLEGGVLRTLARPGPLAWRDQRVFPNLAAAAAIAPSAVTLEVGEQMVELRRRRGRWTAQSRDVGPIEASEEAVRDVLQTLASLRVHRFIQPLDQGVEASSARVTLVTETRSADGQSRTRRQVLGLGAAGDIGGNSVLAFVEDSLARSVVEAVTGPDAGPDAGGDGSRVEIAVVAQQLAKIAVAAELYVDPRPAGRASSEVYAIRIRSDPGEQPMLTARLTIDGWRVEEAGSGPESEASPEEIEGVVGLLTSPAASLRAVGAEPTSGDASSVLVEVVGIDQGVLASCRLLLPEPAAHELRVRRAGVEFTLEMPEDTPASRLLRRLR